MERRLKLLIFALVAAVLCLTAAIVSLRLAEPAGEQTDSEAQPAAPKGAVELFLGANGRWGARAASGRILIEPQWYYLKTMSDTVLIARYSDGKTDRFGLISTNGEQLVPFLYSSITPIGSTAPDLWIASFSENGQNRYHFYHADGTRWSDTAWDAFSYDSGVLSASTGTDRYKGVLRAGRIRWQSLHTEYPVGLHQLVMELDETELAQLPPAETLTQLGSAAADFLRYLFVTKVAPEASLISADNASAIHVDYRYISCRLVSAEISRIKIRETDGLPSYLVQMQVTYQRTEDAGSLERTETAMSLVITRNAAGAYTYSSFSDSQMNASSGGLIN